jgi:hypothetical protein
VGEEALEYLVGIEPLRFCVEIEKDAMTQDRSEQRGYIVIGNVKPFPGEGPCLCRKHDKLSCSHAAAIANVLLYEFRGIVALGTRGTNKVHYIPGH